MEKEGAPDSGRRYYEIYFDDTDAAHVGLAALKGVFNVSKPLSPILLLASDAQLGHYLSKPLGPSCLELMSSTRLPFVREPTILLHNFALTDQVCAMFAQSAASWPACYQFKGASVCWQLVNLPLCQGAVGLPVRQFAVILPVCHQFESAWSVRCQHAGLPARQLAATLPARQLNARLPAPQSAVHLSINAMRQFTVSVLEVSFTDALLAPVLSGQASSNHKLQSGPPTPCSHCILKLLLSYCQTLNLQACPAQYIASEKHPLQQRVSIPGDLIGPKGFASVPELIKLLTTAVTAVAPGATIKPLREDANSSSNVGKLVVNVQVIAKLPLFLQDLASPLFLQDLASPPSSPLQATAAALSSHTHLSAHCFSKIPLPAFLQVPMHWDPLILCPITVVAPNNPDVGYTLSVKGLPTFQHIGALIILKPDIIQIDSPEQVSSPLAHPSPHARNLHLQHFLVSQLSMYLRTTLAADLPRLLFPTPQTHLSPFALYISFSPLCPFQVVEALERAQRRYKLEERPNAPEKTAIKVVTGRNVPFCYYLSADQALTVSIACSPGLIVGTETCRTRLAFKYNTVQVSRGITAAQKKSGLLQEWLAATHIVHAEQ
jgi:hypothetical protein